MIIEMDHIQIVMPAGKEDEAREFYGRILGMEEIQKPIELQSSGGCWFQAGLSQIHLGIMPDFAPATKAHPAFLVDDLEELQERLVAANVAITPDSRVTDVRRFYTNDPFGNRIEFIQSGDGFNE